MMNKVFRQNWFFKCHDKETKREREKEKEESHRVTTEGKAQERKEKKRAMHDNAWTCYMLKKISS